MILCAGLAGCEFLDENPDSRTTIDDPRKIAKLLVSAYPTSNTSVMFEYMSDNVVDNGLMYPYGSDIQYECFSFQNIVATNQDTPYYNWSGCYSAISTANLALESIEKLEDPSVCNAQKAEALLCRAWAHLILTEIFCQPYNPVSSATDLGIPYALEIETTAVNTYERGTVAEVYQKINEDIENALPLIDDNSYTEVKYHFNRSAAYAFAAEFNLYYGNYEKSVEYANVALNNAPALRDMARIRASSSSTDIRNMYIDSKEEANLLIQPTTSSNGYGNGTYVRFSHNTFMTNTQTIGTPGPWGTRLWAYAGGIYGSTVMNALPKMYGIFEITNVLASTGYNHIVMTPFTTDKTIINRAEAYAMQGEYDKAAADLNVWYNAKHNALINVSAADIITFYKNAPDVEATKDLIKPLTGTRLNIELGTDQEYMLQACIHARRIETIHEGYRFLDLKRFGIAYKHVSVDLGDINIESYDKRLAIQLPSAVLSAGMKANPR